MTPEIGYMPGHLTWHFGEKLKALGVTIANTDPDKSTHLDRKLITGASRSQRTTLVSWRPRRCLRK
ncbi:hypothetical protein F2981_33075 (plasmid) [Sinorhizobium meliloti]|nr:hypothetical protein [Sinorhizobium meliloti]